MPLAKEVAIELRKLADALDREPNQEIPQASVYFGCKYVGNNDKQMFLALARILPHPLSKNTPKYDTDAIELCYKSATMTVTTDIKRSKVCKLISPARNIPAIYDCEPLLSAEEDAALTEPVTA